MDALPDALYALLSDPVVAGRARHPDRDGDRARDRQSDLHLDRSPTSLPEAQRPAARRIGIGLALILRLALLGTIAFIVKLTAPVFTVLGHELSWRDIILIGGGLFLVWKATKEIHHRVDPAHGPDMFDGGGAVARVSVPRWRQIIILDLVFSLDSIITAVGMTPHVAGDGDRRCRDGRRDARRGDAARELHQ